MNSSVKFRLKYTNPERIDVTKLSYQEMIYFTSKNVYLHDHFKELMQDKNRYDEGDK